MLLFEWASRIETVAFKLAEGKGLREGWDSSHVYRGFPRWTCETSKLLRASRGGRRQTLEGG
jgi:hypothetical protein